MSSRGIHHDFRTLRGEFNGVTAWTKHAVVPARPFSSMAFNSFSLMTGSPIFRSTHNPDGRAALRAEAARLRYLKERDFHVPEIYEQSDDHLVLSDIGISFADIIEKTPNIFMRRDLFCRAIAHIADIHARGEYHGRSVTKDLTFDGEKAGMIDLEHEPLKVMPLRDAQARDAWLVFLCAGKYMRDDKDLIPAMIGAYIKRAPQDAVDSLRRNTGLINLVGAPVALMLGAFDASGTAASIGHMNSVLHRHLTA